MVQIQCKNGTYHVLYLDNLAIKHCHPLEKMVNQGRFYSHSMIECITHHYISSNTCTFIINQVFFTKFCKQITILGCGLSHYSVINKYTGNSGSTQKEKRDINIVHLISVFIDLYDYVRYKTSQ